MKKFLTLLFLWGLCLPLIFAQVTPVNVHGFVKSQGQPVPGHEVIVKYSNGTATQQLVYTNVDGFYSTNLSTNALDGSLIVATANCDGNLLIDSLAFTPNVRELEANFELCADSIDCNAEFYYTQAGTNGFVFTAFDNSNDLTYTWSFGDGTSETGGYVADHYYQEPGTYEVCLIVSNDSLNCEKIFCKSISVLPAECKADFGYDWTADGEVRFEAIANRDDFRYLWHFGDGNESDNGRIVSHRYEAPGEYQVCLTLFSENGDCQIEKCMVVVSPPRPTCEAKFEIHHGIVSGTIVLENKSTTFTNAFQSFWSFGDGNFSDEWSPVHTYEQSGTYEVCLIIDTPDGCRDTLCEDVIIQLDDCTAEFAYEQTPGSVHEYVFEARSNNPNYIYQWSVGDVAFPISERVFRYQFPGPGTYDVCLVVFSNDSTGTNNCQVSKCKTIVIGEDECTAEFEYTIKDDGEYWFEARGNSPNLAYKWYVNGEILEPNSREFKTRFDEEGEYEVCLLVYSTTDGPEPYCEVRACKTITVGRDDCTATFAYHIEDDGTYVFEAESNNPNYEYFWSVGDLTVVYPGRVLRYKFEEPGEYEVCLFVAGQDSTNGTNSCEDRYCKTIVIEDDECTADFKYDKIDWNSFVFEAASNSDNLVYQWFVNGEVFEENNREFKMRFDGEGTYEVCLLVYTPTDGPEPYCEVRACETIIVERDDCTAEFAYQIEDDGTFVFEARSNNPAYEYYWSVGNLTVVYPGRVLRYQFDDPGEYEVCLLVIGQDSTQDSTNVCEDRYCKTIVIEGDDCTADFNYDLTASGYYVFEAEMVNQPNVVFEWQFSDGVSLTGHTVRRLFDVDGEYEVCLLVYSTLGNCEVRKCKTIRIGNPGCSAYFEYRKDGRDVYFYPVSDSTDPAVIAGSYYWDFGDGNTSTEHAPMHSYTEPGEYKVCLTVISEDSSCVDTFCKDIIIRDGNPCVAHFVAEPIDALKMAWSFHPAIPIDPNVDDLKFYWSFGDGATSDELSPRHRYDEPGKYKVCLTVWSESANCEKQFCLEIMVGTTIDCYAAFNWEYSPDDKSVVHFYADSSLMTGDYGFIWDFGDGDTVQGGKNIRHKYEEPGLYKACLTIVSPNGCTDTRCTDVLIGDPQDCFAYFGAEPLDERYLEWGFYPVLPNDSMGGSANLTFHWDFGDSNQSDELTPIHKYEEPGIYIACLTVTNTATGCRDEYCLEIFAIRTIDCYADFKYEFADSSDNVVIFYADSNLVSPDYRIIWSFGDGDTATGDMVVRHAYTERGIYRVCLTIISPDGCESTKCYQIIIGDNDICIAQFRSEPLDNLCLAWAFHPILTTDHTSADLQFYWDFGDGNTATGFPVRHAFATGGEYEVCLTVKNEATGCEDHYCQKIRAGKTIDCYAIFDWTNENQRPLHIEFLANPDWVLDDYEVIWEFGDGTTLHDVRQPRHEYPAPGEYVACLTIISPDGCKDTKCQTVLVPELDCKAEFKYEMLSALAVKYIPEIPSTDQALMYYWDFGDGNSSTEESPTHTYAQGGDYEVCLTVGTLDESCVNTICKKVSVDDRNSCNPDFVYTDNAGLEKGFSAVEIREDRYYIWFFGDGTDLEFGPVVRHRYDEPGTYLVCLTVTDGFSCFETFCQRVEVTGEAGECVANFGFLKGQNNLYIFQDHSTANGAISHHWDFGDGHSSNDPNPIHQFANDRNYEVCLTITDATGCVSTYCQHVGGYSLEGTVAAGNRPVDYGVAYLIWRNPFDNSLNLVDTTLVQNGAYSFNNVGPGTYLVKTALLSESPVYRDYLPTYLGDVLFWNEAISVVVAASDIALPGINLIPGNNPGGPGFIGGRISAGANKTGQPLGMVSILLLDENGNAVSHNDSNVDGEYAFDNLAWGTYFLHVEIPGILSEPLKITIGPDQPEVTDADFTVGTNIVSSREELTFGKVLELYPNPVLDELQLELELRASAKLKIEVMNLLGQTMIRLDKSLHQGQHLLPLNVSQLAEGVYMLRIQSGDQQLVERIVKK